MHTKLNGSNLYVSKAFIYTQGIYILWLLGHSFLLYYLHEKDFLSKLSVLTKFQVYVKNYLREQTFHGPLYTLEGYNYKYADFKFIHWSNFWRTQLGIM